MHHHPASYRIEANELSHHVLEWRGGSRHASARARRTAVLVHGYMDAAGTWDRVAPALAAEGHRVLALDMRGFGQGARVGRGGYYHFSDYVFDLADALDALVPGEPVALVGHSMGGTIATLLAGTFPERVSHLVSVEGLGPPDTSPDAAPVRMRAWIEGVRRVRASGRERSGVTREQALRRLALNHPGVAGDVLETRLAHLVEERPLAGAARVALLSDPLHRTTSPVPFFTSVFTAFARRVTCPVLFVSGGPRGFHPPDEEARLASFADLTRREIVDAGHMVHWTRPEPLAAEIVSFLADGVR